MSRTERRGWEFQLRSPHSPDWDRIPVFTRSRRDHDCHHCQHERRDKVAHRRRSRRVARHHLMEEVRNDY